MRAGAHDRSVALVGGADEALSVAGRGQDPVTAFGIGFLGWRPVIKAIERVASPQFFSQLLGKKNTAVPRSALRAQLLGRRFSFNNVLTFNLAQPSLLFAVWPKRRQYLAEAPFLIVYNIFAMVSCYYAKQPLQFVVQGHRH